MSLLESVEVDYLPAALVEVEVAVLAALVEVEVTAGAVAAVDAGRVQRTGTARPKHAVRHRRIKEER